MIFNLLSRFWIAVIKSLRHMPVSARSALAGFLALLFWIAIPKRRRVTLTNLRLCFPNKTDAERKKIAKSFYRKLMRAALDHGVLWSGTREEVAAMVRFEGVENITETVARGEHLIVISPHFVGLDAAGIGYEKTDVGDKYVAENMRANGHLIGGEQSGHIIFQQICFNR